MKSEKLLEVRTVLTDEGISRFVAGWREWFSWPGFLADKLEMQAGVADLRTAFPSDDLLTRCFAAFKTVTKQSAGRIDLRRFFAFTEEWVAREVERTVPNRPSHEGVAWHERKARIRRVYETLIAIPKGKRGPLYDPLVGACLGWTRAWKEEPGSAEIDAPLSEVEAGPAGVTVLRAARQSLLCDPGKEAKQ
jgi:hypothetical protein